MATKQINVIVKKTAKMRPSWFVTCVEHTEEPGYLTVVLPGEFTLDSANFLGMALAAIYSTNGYDVAFKRAVRGRDITVEIKGENK